MHIQKNFWCAYVHPPHSTTPAATRAALPIDLLHATTITVEARWICDCITVHKTRISHPPIHYVAQDYPNARTKVNTCHFDFVLGFCLGFYYATDNSCNQHTTFLICAQQWGGYCILQDWEIQ
jgi:hypothetical protein